MKKSMKNAIVTLAVGDTYIKNFHDFCRPSWKAYAKQYDLDLVVITESMDLSERGKSRSPAWQKCLILSHEAVRKYDQVAWIDSDILINPGSPNIFDQVPLESVGAVDCYATPNREEHRLTLERLYKFWTETGVAFVNNLTATSFHEQFGLEGEFESVVQTGVLILSPTCHKDLLEDVYNGYEDKGPAWWNYEMRPLSYEILKKASVHWLNPKFNMPWPYIKQFQYPFLNRKNSIFRRALRKMNLGETLTSKCATTAFLNNYFLHFSGSAGEMKFVNQAAKSIFEI